MVLLHEMATDGHKRCPKCAESKPLTNEFWGERKKEGKIGWENHCRICKRRRGRDHYWRNRESIRAKGLEARNKDREKYRANARLAAENRRVARMEYVENIKRGTIQKRYCIHKNCPCCKTCKYAVEFYTSNRTIDGLTSYCKRCTNLKNLSRKTHGGKIITPQIIDSLLANQNNSCFYCNKLVDGDNRPSYHVEHKIPISRGGTNVEENLCISCCRCNLVKNNLTHLEFFKSKRFLSILLYDIKQSIVEERDERV
jgi:HNH endonuclease